jgi:hypothetical protein
MKIEGIGKSIKGRDGNYRTFDILKLKKHFNISPSANIDPNETIVELWATIYHLYHGSRINRAYFDRFKLMEDINNIKDIFRDSQYSALGYPDGIRITINAIVSTNETGDTQLDNVESVALQATTGPEIESALIYLEQKPKPEELQGGIVKTPGLVKIGAQKLKKTKKVKKVKKAKKAKKTKKAKKAKKTKKAKKAKKTNKAKKSKKRFIKK